MKVATKLSIPLIAAAVLMSFAGCDRSPVETLSQGTRPVVQAAVLQLAKSSVVAPYEAVGTVRSKTAATIQSKAMGHVRSVNVKEGDTVQAGQVLVEIDNREALAQVQRAQSAVREAQDARQEADNATQAATHGKDAAEAGSQLALATYNRFKGLEEKGAISRQAFDEASAKWKGAAAQAAQASETMLSIQAKRSEAEARIAQAKAELESARTSLSHTRVSAPFDGIVTKKTVDVGDLAAPGTPLFEVEDPQQYRLEALVDESLVSHITAGQKVPVILDAVKSGELAGTVSEIVPAADSASRTFVVKVDLPHESAIKSGMFGRARFSLGQEETLTVPASVIVHRGQLTGVYAVGDDGVARLRLITTGKRYGDQVEVLSGIEAGDRIVSSNVDQMADGAMVQQDTREGA